MSKHTPIVSEGRTRRIVERRNNKKTMKSLIRKLKGQLRVSLAIGVQAFEEGRRSVREAAHGLDYGGGYEVLPVADSVVVERDTLGVDLSVRQQDASYDYPDADAIPA